MSPRGEVKSMQAVAAVLFGTFVWIMYWMVIGIAYAIWYTAVGIWMLGVWLFELLQGSKSRQ